MRDDACGRPSPQFRACLRSVNKRLSRLPEALVAQLGGDAGAGGSSCDYGGSYPPLALRIVPVGTEYISGIQGEIRDRFAAVTSPLPASVSACLLAVQALQAAVIDRLSSESPCGWQGVPPDGRTGRREAPILIKGSAPSAT